MLDNEKRRKFIAIAKKIVKINTLIEKRYGKDAETIGSEMDDLVAAEEDLFELYGIPATEINQYFIFETIEEGMKKVDFDAAFQVFSRLGEEQAREHDAPLEALVKAVADVSEASNALPKAGFTHHDFQIYLYTKILEDPDNNLVPCFNAMVKAEPVLGEIYHLKSEFTKLDGMRIAFLREYLDS